MTADHDPTEAATTGPEPLSAPITQGEREEGWDDRWCGREKANGERCKAFRVRGQEACAGHLGLGIGEDPAAHAKRAAEASARARSDRAEERKRGPQDVYRATLVANAEDYAARLDKIIRDGSDADALRALEQLTSRVLGKPRELVEQVSKPADLQAIEDMSDEEFFAAWRAMQAEGL